MHEFDRLMKDLTDEVSKKGVRDLAAKKAYQNLVDEFSSRRAATALKRYGSVEGVRRKARKKKGSSTVSMAPHMESLGIA